MFGCLLIWVFISQTADGCKTHWIRTALWSRMRWRNGKWVKGGWRKGRQGGGTRSGPSDPETCTETHQFRLLPVHTVIENVPSWQECGEQPALFGDENLVGCIIFNFDQSLQLASPTDSQQCKMDHKAHFEKSKYL